MESFQFYQLIVKKSLELFYVQSITDVVERDNFNSALITNGKKYSTPVLHGMHK